ELRELGGLYRSHPMLAVLFMVPALSLAGLPPLSGFFAKFIIIRAGIEVEAWLAVAVALIVGLLTLYSMVKIWNEVFWKAQPEGGAGPQVAQGSLVWMWTPIVALALMTVMIGLYGQPVFEMAERSAAQLLDTSGYIEAVLGGNPR
ncbi:MAG: Na+/H+ antiporter subunit D, partial [Thioalkalivibrio sp.]|nr:Na+/H+ antiporter subunit D [Thioalkalivibrio sp.]